MSNFAIKSDVLSTANAPADTNYRVSCMSRSGQYMAIGAGYISTDAGSISISSDYGNTWSSNNSTIASGNRIGQLAMDGSGKYILAITYNTPVFYISTNYGITWNRCTLTTPTGGFWSNATISSDSSYMYMVGSNGFYKLNNVEGVNYNSDWEKKTTIIDSPGGATLATNQTGQYVFASTAYPNYNLSASSDYGNTWTIIFTAPPPQYYTSQYSWYAPNANTNIVLDDTGQYIYYIGQYAAIVKSSDYGNTWSDITMVYGLDTPVSLGGYAYGIACSSNGQYLYISANIYRNSDRTFYAQIAFTSTDYGNTLSFPSLTPSFYANAGSISCNSAGSVVIGVTPTAYIIRFNYNNSISNILQTGSQYMNYNTNFLEGGDSTWNTLTNISQQWTSIVSNQDSTIFAGCYSSSGNPGGIYISTNSGRSWSLTSAPILEWTSITCSGTGKYMYACSTNDGYIYVSSTTGNTWTLTSTDVRNYTCIATDILGVNVFASSSDYYSGYLYSSTNYGVSWIVLDSFSLYWSSITCSSDGTYAAACASGDGNGVYTTSNSGSTWNRTSLESAVWTSVSSDSTGKYLVASNSDPGTTYSSSTYGSTWVQSSIPNRQWSAIKNNGNGQYVVACAYNDYIYTSSDYGISWIVTPSIQSSWSCLSCSYNGHNIFAGDNSPGYIYSSLVLMDISLIYAAVPSGSTIYTTNFKISSSLYTIKLLELMYSTYVANVRQLQNDFCSIAISRSGQYIYAASSTSDAIYSTSSSIIVSSNYGSSWINANITTASNSPIIDMHSISCSYSGQYVAAGSRNNSITGSVGIWISNNYGITWNRTNTNEISSIYVSSTGQYISGWSLSSATYYYSTNYGSSFTLITPSPTTGSAKGNYISSNATYQYMCSSTSIFRSSTSGNSWTNITPSGTFTDWQSITSSQTGQYVTAAYYTSGRIYTSSDYGDSWSQTSAPVNMWTSVSCDSTGQYISACGSGTGRTLATIPYCYKSSDYGSTWTKIVNNYSTSSDMFYSTAITDTNLVYTCSRWYNNLNTANAGVYSSKIYAETTSPRDIDIFFSFAPYTAAQQPISPTPVMTGLTNYYNFIDPSCCDISGAVVISGRTIKNLITNTADMQLYTASNTLTYDLSTCTMIFNNVNSSYTLNTACMYSYTSRSIQSVSIWYRQLAPSSATYSYLFDGRHNSGTLFVGNTATGISSQWKNMYYDGGPTMTPAWSGTEFTQNTWHNITFTAPLSYTGGLTFFAQDSTRQQAANIQVAAIMVYNRQLTQDENTQNYRYMKKWYMSSFGLP